MVPKKTIDLNCDLGELPAGQAHNYDAEIMPYISSCNLACGFHSGTPLLLEKTILSAIRHGVKIGAHPSYNDRKNFGRLSLKIDATTLLAELRYQICALKGMVESYGHGLYHVKPHGALYNDLLINDSLAEQFVLLVKNIDPRLKILSLAHGNVLRFCEQHGLQGVREGFADRRYAARTQLRSRRYDDAVLHQPEEVLAQVEGFLNGEVRLVTGKTTTIEIDSLCLHSDTPGAVQLSQTIHHYLKDHDVNIRAVE